MKKIAAANQKGGVGKSALSTQFAYYCAIKRGLRTLFLDLDHQAHATKPITNSGLATVASVTATDLLTRADASIEPSAFTLVPADPKLKLLEREGLQAHNAYAQHLHAALERVDAQFDVCIIDTNPNPDVRVTLALVMADYVVSPVQLNQEAIDGIKGLYTDLRGVKAKLNPKLEFIGLLPNMVENKPFQKANLAQIMEHYAQLLIKTEQGKFAAIPNRTAIAEAQAQGVPVWTLDKTSARDAWADLQPVFETLANRMGV